MPTLPAGFIVNKLEAVEVPISNKFMPAVDVQSSNKDEGVVVPMPTLPFSLTYNFPEPTLRVPEVVVATISSVLLKVEEALRMMPTAVVVGLMALAVAKLQLEPPDADAVCQVAKPLASEVRTLLAPGVPPVILNDGVSIPPAKVEEAVVS